MEKIWQCCFICHGFFFFSFCRNRLHLHLRILPVHNHLFFIRKLFTAYMKVNICLTLIITFFLRLFIFFDCTNMLTRKKAKSIGFSMEKSDEKVKWFYMIIHRYIQILGTTVHWLSWTCFWRLFHRMVLKIFVQNSSSKMYTIFIT
jgi:hypothetical protein